MLLKSLSSSYYHWLLVVIVVGHQLLVLLADLEEMIIFLYIHQYLDVQSSHGGRCCRVPADNGARHAVAAR